MHTIALVNQKGGVGKSTTAVNLSAGLARLGRRVLLIDLDPQAHSTVALGIHPKKVGASIYSLLSGVAPVKDVIKPIAPGLSLIPSTINLAGGEAELTWQQNPHYILKKAMAELGDDSYEFAIIDSPPQLGFLNVNSLAWVKNVFIPVTCEFYALHGLSLLVETVERIKGKLNPDLEIRGVITGQFNPRRALTKDVIADLENHFPGRVLKSRIRVNVRLAEAPSHGQSIHDYAPGSNGSKDFMNLAKEVLEILPAAAAPEVVAQLEAIERAKAEAQGKLWKESPEPVVPTWSAPAEEAPAETAPVAEAAPAPEVAPVAPLAAVVESTPSVDPLADLMGPAAEEPAPIVVAPAPVVEMPAPIVVAPAPVVVAPAPVVEAPAPVIEAPVVVAEAPAPVVEAPAPIVEAPAAPVTVEADMPAPADEGRVYEPTSPMIASAAEVAAMTAPPAEEKPAETVAEAETAPVAEDVDDKAARLGFDPYAESSAHIETEPAPAPAVEPEPAKAEFVSSLPATPVAELRAAISSDAPTQSSPESTVKPVPALPSVKAASVPFNDRLAMAGLKPIVTAKPGQGPKLPDKKGFFSKFWGK
jgi:chromosome partitioning protein